MLDFYIILSFYLHNYLKIRDRFLSLIPMFIILLLVPALMTKKVFQSISDSAGIPETVSATVKTVVGIGVAVGAGVA
jgi:hypothetical protein